MTYVSYKTKLRILWTAVAAMCLLTRSGAAPASDGTSEAIMYLSHYGYLSPSLQTPSVGHMVDEKSMRNAIAEFQSMFGLNVTGKLDEETTKIMSLPRCGVPDKVYEESRAKRNARKGFKWSKKNLTYKISNYPSSLTTNLRRADVDAELARAFSVWSNYTDLTFSPKSYGNVDIIIRYEKQAHGDGGPFDGPGGILAHSVLHNYDGEVHFDDAEQWTMNSSEGINLFQVAVHELGHMLGLKESQDGSSAMYSFYHSFDPDYQPNRDDIRQVQALYGRDTRASSDDGGDGHSGALEGAAEPLAGTRIGNMSAGDNPTAETTQRINF